MELQMGSSCPAKCDSMIVKVGGKSIEDVSRAIEDVLSPVKT
jgi:hypothetical protein